MREYERLLNRARAIEAEGGEVVARDAAILTMLLNDAEVVIPEDLLARIPESHQESLRGVLAQDPRPHYQNDPERVYGFGFAGMEVRFRVDGNVLTVTEVL